MMIHPSLSLSLFVLLLFCRFSVWLSDLNRREKGKRKKERKKEGKKGERKQGCKETSCENFVARQSCYNTAYLFSSRALCTLDQSLDPVRALFTDAYHLAIQLKGIQF